jgi:nucleoside-diphosphate-sugar epimerase
MNRSGGGRQTCGEADGMTEGSGMAATAARPGDGAAAGPVGPVLVTGSNGFLGRAVTRRLLARGETVVALDIAPAGDAAQRDGAPGRLVFCPGDIRDGEALCDIAARQGVRAIVHLAAPNIPACRERPVAGAGIIVLGHVNVFETARRLGIGRLVYTSSIAARPRGPLATQSNLYGAFKQCCENISKVYYLDHGIASVGLRPNVVYGPGRETGETSAITQAMRAAAEGRPYAMPFGGTMSFQHVDEVTEVLLRCLEVRPAEPVIGDLASATQTVDEVIAAIRAVRPEARIERSATERPAPPALDDGPLRALLGSWERVSLAEGARRTIAHYAARAADPQAAGGG